MSKLKVQDFEYYYPRDMFSQAQKEMKFPEELQKSNLTFLIREKDKILTSKNSKINYQFAKKLVDRYKKQIENQELNKVLMIRFGNIDIDVIKKENGIIVRYTCQVFTWDNLLDVTKE